ncbi:RNA methyltransferase [Paenibacillus sp. J31TS4]|uniref:TrmH family RNA methyltransferase n=1 Tax=Paenibacillus sp. J31TS4 TaxID=2807195 RepID=UPI0020BE1F4D|nr:RNA methyltransferase [Paenibacillus sp. J31TS4]
MNNIQELTSVNNPKIKQWAQLLTRKGREAQGKYLLEGTHLVQEALQAGAPVEAILFQVDKGLPPELAGLAHGTAEWYAVPEPVLAKCSETKTPQGIVAVVAKAGSGAEAWLYAEDALVVAVDGVQDPGNLGTIIRAADAAGATGVVLGAGTVDLYSPKTVRATMGSLFHVPVVSADLPALLAEAGRRGIRTVTARLDAKQTIYEADLAGPVWLILGNEGAGVSAEAAALATDSVLIPMRGQSESLNVAMAATVLLYEAMRQRG